jgi:hypothetical protein
MSHRKFLIYLAIISLPIIFFTTVSLEVFTRKILIPNDIINQKEQMLLNKKDNIKIISLGDSHTMYNMNINSPEYFNFGISSEPVPIWYFKLKWLIKNNPKLKSVLLQADYHIFSDCRTKDVEYLTKQYVKYIDEKVDNNLGNYPLPGYSGKITFYSMQINYSKIVLKSFFNYIVGSFKKPDILDNGSFVKESGNSPFLSKQEKIEKAKIRFENHFSCGSAINQGLVDYYEKIIKLANDNNIKIFLVRYPLSEEYIALAGNMETEFSDLLGYFSEKYKISILDYKNEFCGIDNAFESPDHLSGQFAEKLGDIVFNDMKKNDK